MDENYLKNVVGATLLPNVGGFIMGVYFRPHRNRWYKQLKKPNWTPPNYVFGPMWTLLYSGMGYASYIVWQNGGGFDGDAKLALSLYGAQLALNWAWTPIFFGARSPKLGLVDLGLLVVVSAATGVAFYKIRPLAGLLMVPYLAWLGLATALNYSIVQLNGSNQHDE